MRITPLIAVHLLASAIYLGSTVLTALLLEVVGVRSADAVIRRRRYAELFRVYSPLAIAMLLVVLMTGAWSLTGLKESLGPGFGSYAVSKLATKLGIAFLVIMNATYVALGIGHRLVRADQGALPVTDAALARTRNRLRAGLWLSVLLVITAAWFSLDGPRPGA